MSWKRWKGSRSGGYAKAQVSNARCIDEAVEVAMTRDRIEGYMSEREGRGSGFCWRFNPFLWEED